MCQLCAFDCHAFYCRVKALSPPERVQAVMASPFRLAGGRHGAAAAASEPVEGDFWQADHITAVAEGGGECGLANMRTLCTPCHAKETAALLRRLKHEKASKGSKDIRGFFAQ